MKEEGHERETEAKKESKAKDKQTQGGRGR